MNAVISVSQARQITRGRTPLVPIEYETAVKSLSACLVIDDAKVWADKSDALAAWAKIYQNPEVMRKAKALKLHAYRRMGQLAQELRPPKPRGGRTGREPGAVLLLQEHGMSKMNANAASRLALLTEKKFERLLENPKAPTTIMHELWNTDPTWRSFTHGAMTLRSFCRANTPAQIAAFCKANAQYAGTARDLAIELVEWFDELEDRISKMTKAA